VQDHPKGPGRAGVSAEETPVVEQAPTPQPAEPAATPTGNDADVLDGFVDAAKPVAVVAGGIGLLGGMLLFTLRRLRHVQAARRRPSTTIDASDAGFHTATDDAKGWTLSADLDARVMEAETRGDAPLAPRCRSSASPAA